MSDTERQLWLAVFCDGRFLSGVATESSPFVWTLGALRLEVRYVRDDQFRGHLEAAVSEELGTGPSFQRLLFGQDNWVSEFNIRFFTYCEEATAFRVLAARGSRVKNVA